METVKINCPKCGLEIEYWTKNNYIECPGCKEIIGVEPCKEEERTIQDEEIEEE